MVDEYYTRKEFYTCLFYVNSSKTVSPHVYERVKSLCVEENTNEITVIRIWPPKISIVQNAQNSFILTFFFYFISIEGMYHSVEMLF